ncbi:MAG: IS66 family transposase [Armatimonadetes bacterium]|nr:IS66 family transposase [Akkermansiaceae bacterium]
MSNFVTVSEARPTREQLIELARRDPEAIADLVLMLWDRVEALEAKVAALERNSRTSSKPPSSDKGNFTNPPKPKSLREKSGRKPSGQPGHRGDTLRQTPAPDHVEEHRLAEGVRCAECGAPLSTAPAGVPLDCGSCERRQVFELPAIRIEVTEHRAEKTFCQRCGTVATAAFPDGVAAPVQYGPGVRATALYLGGYQLIPYARLAESFAELFGCPLSQGTLANFVRSAGENARQAMRPVRAALLGATTAHADETGCTVQGKRHWLHIFSTRSLSCYHLDAKRGAEAMERGGLISRYSGNLIHDCLGAYETFLDCHHFYCNAHLQRELTYLHEEMHQPWAADMIDLLLEAKALADLERARLPGTRRVIGERTEERIISRDTRIVLTGLAANPEPPPPPPGTKGRIKRGKPLNLLRRLDRRPLEIMGFFVNPEVPYDNNQAERDLRMMKVREKISGTFRSGDHGPAFCDIRSIISSVRKQSRGMLDSLVKLIASPTMLGEELASGQPT